MLINNTDHAVTEAVLTDPEGREVFMVVVKASFEWRPDGSVQPLADAIPIAKTDVFAGAPATTGLLAAGDMTLPKPRVDVLIQGEITLGTPADQIDCSLEIGHQLAKSVRVFGDRHWRRGAAGTMLPSRAQPFVRMPIDWRRSFGGTDPDDPSCLDLRNPVGRGVRRRALALEGHPAPNFEAPNAPVADPSKNPAPVGWGPIAPHWQARGALAGTYDERWKAERFPLLPVDFDPAFRNAAPPDQQLPRYLPGVEVRLANFTPQRRDRFVLPELAPPVTVVDARRIFELGVAVDTIVIEPTERRFTLVARAVHAPFDIQGLTVAVVGALTPDQRRQLRADAR